MNKNSFEKLTPFELGKLNDISALDFLTNFLMEGDLREKITALEAISKLTEDYEEETKKTIPYILATLNNNNPQVRQYSLKALTNFELSEEQLEEVKMVIKNDDRDSNRNLARIIVENNGVATKKSSDKNGRFNDEINKQLDILNVKPRDKNMYLYTSRNMEMYSANYAYTNHNFVIQNNGGELLKDSPYYPVICILKNIIMRGCPSLPSEFLKEKMGDIQQQELYDKPFYFITNKPPIWINRIKGDTHNNNFPAKTFLNDLIPEYLPEYEYIQQLMLPEVLFSDILLEDVIDFKNEQVDFFLPQANLVIEIDGQQHKLNRVTELRDKDRDKYLLNYGIKTIRIDSKDIRLKTSNLQSKMNDIKKHIEEYEDNFHFYKKSYQNMWNELEDNINEEKMYATAIMRFQILILSLLEKGKLKLTDKEWKLSVIERDIKMFEEIALEDLFIWLKNLCKLHKLEFKVPKISLLLSEPESPVFRRDYLDIDFSLLQRWTDENEIGSELNRIYVRTDYFDNNNYFSVSTDKLIKYNIIPDGEESDIPALEFFIRNIFGFDSFNDGQLLSIISSLKGENTIGLLPTGGGKSLIYQYVGLLQPCISFVVAPIISLLKDQRDGLDRRHIHNTNYINSMQEPSMKKKIQKEYGSGKYQFLLISPERFQTKEFRNQLIDINSSFVIGIAVIDEVHCLSEWGHDFRTSYLNLAKTIRTFCPQAIILGLTATASVNVLKDILIEFQLTNNNVRTLPSFTRKELNFRILKLDNNRRISKGTQLKKLLSEINSSKKVFKLDGENTKSGLIFTRNVNGSNGCYSVSNTIKAQFSIDSKWYSGKCPTKNNQEILDNNSFNYYKEKVQDDFINNKFPLLVATKAFGMGIDKSNIRYTIHYGIPGSLESLYQEAGRAGRDKQNADCYIIFDEDQLSIEQSKNLFDIKSNVNQIKDAVNEFGYESKDAVGNMWLWMQGLEDIDHEANGIYRLFEYYTSVSSSRIFEGSRFKLGKSTLEKYIYKLSLLGIIEDWTIEDWSSNFPKIEVQFKDFSDESVMEALLIYVKKYDPEFSLEKEYNSDGSRNVLNSIYMDEKLNIIQKAIKILLIWQYENIAYHRRQSIKTVYDQCKEKYNKPEEFKKYMESYFKFTDVSFKLDYVAEKPKDTSRWFEVFYESEEVYGSKLESEKLTETKANLRRFLESYRYNTGLNYISGMLNLMTDDFNNQDGRERLELAFEQIVDYDAKTKEEILENTLLIGQSLDEDNKVELSRLLNKTYSNNEAKIYNSLNDNHSLTIILDKSVDRLRMFGGSLYD